MMKRKLFYSFIIIVLLIIFLFPKAKTPYSGKYLSKSTNEELVLHADDTFNLIITSYKNSVNIAGNYKIKNNYIKLSVKDKSEIPIIKNISSGEVNGSDIVFPQLKHQPDLVFTKS